MELHICQRFVIRPESSVDQSSPESGDPAIWAAGDARSVPECDRVRTRPGAPSRR
jgi:hypothetical protein